MSDPGLVAELRLTRGALAIDAMFTVGPGETIAVLGPNGAGKTSAVHALAGLVRLQGGRVVCDGEVLADVARGVDLPPEARPTALMFQDYRLFPHMSAVDNVAYGLRSRGQGGPASESVAREMLARFGLENVAALHPSQLSGGQAQRTALARALVTRPRLLLLDEPLGALDSSSRPAARSELAELLKDFDGQAIVVTHDPVDAMTLADRLLVMEEGRVVQEGRTAEIAAHPRSRYVADFVGVNLYRGAAAAGSLMVDGHALAVASEIEGDAFAVLHPRAVALHRERPGGSPRNTWRLRIDAVESATDRVRVSMSGSVPLVAEVTPAAVEDLALAAGGEVWAEVKATAFSVYPA